MKKGYYPLIKIGSNLFLPPIMLQIVNSYNNFSFKLV